MEFTAQQIANIIQGKIEGNPDVKINNLSRIQEGTPGTITFLANKRYAEFIYNTNASVVIVNEDFEPEYPINATLIRVPNAYHALAVLLNVYMDIKSKQNEKKGIASNTAIAKTAKLGENVYIGEFTYVGENVVIGNNVKIYPNSYIGDNCEIKDNTVIYPGVKIYDDCKIGANCKLHSGCVIGADGFGFAPDNNNIYLKIPQMGNVVIEDNVEIGSNTTIDRATIGSTIIRKGVKLDNLIQVAHNVEIGENTVIAAQTGIAGSSKIGKDCMIGGQVGIINHVTIADKVKIAAQSGIGSNITTEGITVQGSPAFAIGDYKRAYVAFRKLHLIEEELQQLKSIINSKTEN